MLFLEQEKEKFMAWCHDISMKELALYFISALGLLLLVFLYYDALGITGLFQWYRFGRNMGECFLLIFLTELMTGKICSTLSGASDTFPFFLGPGISLCADSRGERHEGPHL